MNSATFSAAACWRSPQGVLGRKRALSAVLGRVTAVRRRGGYSRLINSRRPELDTRRPGIRAGDLQGNAALHVCWGSCARRRARPRAQGCRYLERGHDKHEHRQRAGYLDDLDVLEQRLRLLLMCFSAVSWLDAHQAVRSSIAAMWRCFSSGGRKDAVKLFLANWTSCASLRPAARTAAKLSPM